MLSAEKGEDDDDDDNFDEYNHAQTDDWVKVADNVVDAADYQIVR